MTTSDSPACAPPAVGPALQAAYAHCARVTQAHYENFPVASRLLPKALRPHVCAVYAFARAADDFADEPAYEGRRLERLSEWEGLLDACMAGATDHPVFIALGDTVRRFDLPAGLLRDLLTAFRMDVTARRHATFDDLLNYCRYSANSVGRIVLCLFGLRDPDLAAWSDRICTALQLTNFWQDIAVDLRKDRIYLPLSDLERFDVTEDDLRAGRCTPAFADLLRSEIARTRDLFRQGAPLINALREPRMSNDELRMTNKKARYSTFDIRHSTSLPFPHSNFDIRRLSLELRLTRLGGMRILDRIEAAGCDVFRRRPTLTKWDWIALLYRLCLSSPTAIA